MDEETLNSILQEKVKPDVNFLSELNKVEVNEQSKKDISNSVEEIVNTSAGKYHCKYSDGFGTDSLPELMNHYRTSHPEHKGVNRAKKEKLLNEGHVVDNMIDNNETETSLDIVSPIEIEESKPQKQKKEKEKPIAEIPDDYSRLASILKNFGVTHWAGIIEGMKIRDINDLTALRNYLISVSCPQVKTDAIVKMWAELQGIKNKDDSSQKVNNEKSPTPTDALSLMAKLRDEEIQDSIVSSYQEKLKSKKLENEIAIKRLSGEFMDNKNLPDINKLVELEMLKYQLMNQKPNQELDLLKLQLMSPKDNGVSELKAEISKLYSYLSTPKSDPQVEILKQQIELQNKRYDELQRKIEEDTKLSLIREEARRDRESLEKKIEDQNRQTQDILKNIQTSNAPKAEDLMKQQIAEIQKQSDAKMQTVLDQLKLANDNKRDEESRRTIELLKEEIKNTKDQSMGAVSQVADGMKSFATEVTHAIEKREMKDEHEKRENDLKKKISDIEHNRSMTNEQYVMEKTTKLAEEAVKAVGGALDGFGKALQPATQKAAESSSIMEKAALAMDLKRQGLSEQTINTVLNQQTSRPVLPSAKQEYENLSRMTEQIQMNNPQPQPIQTPQVSNIMPNEPMSELPIEPIRFATGDKE